MVVSAAAFSAISARASRPSHQNAAPTPMKASAAISSVHEGDGSTNRSPSVLG
jgi:hypothetical protein